MKRRPRVVSAEECPRCRARVGETCKGYNGRGCAPHALEVSDEERPDEKRQWVQRDIADYFPQEGGAQ